MLPRRDRRALVVRGRESPVVGIQYQADARSRAATSRNISGVPSFDALSTTITS